MAALGIRLGFGLSIKAMLRLRPLSFLIVFTCSIACCMAITTPRLVQATRFGIEFRGGYEIYYVADPQTGEAQVTPDALLKTAILLRQRADGIGMAEPEITIEGKNHIRMKIAGLSSVDVNGG